MDMNKLISAILLACILMLATALAFAQTEVRQGAVTRAPWQDSYTRIEIDHKLYTFMPEATLYQRSVKSAGGYDEKAIAYYNVFIGKQVEFQAQGRRIYSLVVLP